MEGDIANGKDEYAVGNDGNNKPLAEGDNNDDNEYAKDSNIANDNNKYAIGNDAVDKPLAKGINKYDTLSVPPARKHAFTLRASYSQQAALRI
jgi:hypothetical protein